MQSRCQKELNEVRSRDPYYGTGPIEPSVEPGCPQYPAPIGFTATESSRLHLQLPMGPPYAAMPKDRLVHQIAFAMPTPPVTSTRRLRGRVQSSQQLLWTAAPSLEPERFHGIWAMASPAPARCGATANLRALRTCPWQISFASKDNLACGFVLTELQALADRGGGSVRVNPLRSHGS